MAFGLPSNVLTARAGHRKSSGGFESMLPRFSSRCPHKIRRSPKISLRMNSRFYLKLGTTFTSRLSFLLFRKLKFFINQSWRKRARAFRRMFWIFCFWRRLAIQELTTHLEQVSLGLSSRLWLVKLRLTGLMFAETLTAKAISNIACLYSLPFDLISFGMGQRPLFTVVPGPFFQILKSQICDEPFDYIFF